MEVIKQKLSLVIFFFTNFVAYCAPPPPPGLPPPVGVVIDTEIPVLFGIGILLGIYFILKKKDSKIYPPVFNKEHDDHQRKKKINEKLTVV